MSDVYEQAEERMSGRGRTASVGQQFLKFDQPAAIGSRTRKEVRIVQRLAMNDLIQKQPLDPLREFWALVDEHGFKPAMIGLTGDWTTFNCPDTNIHDSKDWRSHVTCPLCMLQNELWLTKNPAFKGMSEMLRWKTKVYANAIDMDDVASHWEQQPDKTYKIAPKIWGFSRRTFNRLLAFCRNTGPIEDWQNGRNIVVEIRRKGSEKMEVEYTLTPVDSTPVNEQLMPVVCTATDLSGLIEPETMDRLRELAVKVDPRSGHAAALPAAGGYAPPAQGYSAPPPTPQHPVGAVGPVYNYNGPGGQETGLSAADVAQRAMSAGTHHVWSPGWPNWVEAGGVPEIGAEIAKINQQAAGQPPPGPPTAGMPHSMPPPNPPAQGGNAGYLPQGGYPQGPPPQNPPAAAPPPQQAPPPAGPPAPPGGPTAGPPQPPGGSSF